MSYKKIMVAIDGSETSNLALMEAIQLAKICQAALKIIHVADEFPIYNLAMGMSFDHCRELIRNDGQKILEKMKQVANENKLIAEIQLIEILDASKKISEKIIETIKAWEADLLVIGTHGRRGFRRLLLGSVAEEAVRISPIPVLLVRATEQNPHVLPYQRIIVAVDGSHTSYLALKEAMRLTKELNGKLYIVNVVNEFPTNVPLGFTLSQEQTFLRKEGNAILHKMKEIALENGITPEILLIEITNEVKRISEALIEAIPTYKADLLVMGTHGRCGFNRFILGSVAEESIRTASSPVLLVRAKEEI